MASIPRRHVVAKRRRIRGVGEGGNIIGPPTLVNAIADALSPFGEIALELPLTPAKILKLIQSSN